MADLPGKALAQELIAQSLVESRGTPMEAVIEAVRDGRFHDEHATTRRTRCSTWTLTVHDLR
jgi:hypothetical protein